MTRAHTCPPRANLRALLCALLLAACGPAAADAFIVGVGTHLLNADGDPLPALTLARDAGITSLRDDAWWAHVELQPGELHTPPNWGKYLAAQQQLGLGSVLILGYGNQYYNRDAKPVSQTVRNGFARYVDFTTRQLKGQPTFWEVYNEWDIAKPRMSGMADSRAYLKLVNDTAAQVRRNDPKATLLAGAVTTGGIKSGFADRLVEGGVMQQVDGLSLHPYVHCEGPGKNTPEAWINWLAEVSAHLDSLNGGQPVPLYLTEMGWHSSFGQHPCGVSQNTQAAYLARSFLLARTLPAIKGMWWYDLVNDDHVPDPQEQHFGLLTSALAPKPAWGVLKAIAPLVRNARFDGLHLDGEVYQLAFSQGNEHWLAVWRTGNAAPYTVSVTGSAPAALHWLDTATPASGLVDASSTWQCQASTCTAQLPLSDFPLLVPLGQARLAALESKD